MARVVLAVLRRPSRFLVVGAVCFGVQYGFLVLLGRAGVPAWAGNAIGFFASAQLNFALSSVVTWGDRPARRGRTVLRRWASYQGSTLLVLCANVAVFTVVSPYVWHIIAAGVGVVVGSGCSYAINHLLIFRGSRPVGEVAG